MPFYDECCVLIPASTLEDFPSSLSDSDARSLLAAWTVLWHPALLAAAEQMPVWYRADAPPDPIGRRLVTVANPCVPLLPEGLEQRTAMQADGCWVRGDDREAMLAAMSRQWSDARRQPPSDNHPALAVDPRLGDCWPSLTGDERSIGVEDFYAAGYAALQVQVMTRRLRYTSNLDEIHLQTRLIAAAKAFLEGQGQLAIAALHDVFDALAEERDHYFSSDPHLIDLTLCVPSTVGSLLDSVPADEAETATLPTPANVLIDAETSKALARCDDPRRESLFRSIAEGRIGWAGGGPSGDICLDAMTLAQAESVFIDAWRTTTEAIGTAPTVYGRFSGTTPADMTRTLAGLGFRGVIPMDFASGSGFGDEAKVILQSAGTQLEALTAKPMDASSDSAFLTLGTRLGEAIDSGEIATALLAHWPGAQSTAMQDLRRVATWSLVLGRFWKLDDYFTDGERPYHHGSTQSNAPDAHELLERLVEQKQPDPISSLAAQFRSAIETEQREVLRGMTCLVAPTQIEDQQSHPATAFASAVIGQPIASESDGDDQPGSVIAINPHAAGVRHQVTVYGGEPRDAKHLFGVSCDGHRCDATIDLPGCGFVVVRGAQKRSQSSLTGLFRSKLIGGPKAIAEADGLKNEFMEIAISPQSGGIAGVYSGGARGNRFSMRLVRHRAGLDADKETVMKCEKFSTENLGNAMGRIETSGGIEDVKSGARLASFSLRYSLARGSRFLRVDGEVIPTTAITGSPWHEYLAARVAVATESAICRSLVRDKLHRARSKRIVSPLGLVIDEAERQTLVSGCGLAFHRRAGERFLDSLLQVEGESRHTLQLHYGFDVPNPVIGARSLIAPPSVVPFSQTPAVKGGHDIGWIVHASSKDLLLSQLNVAHRQDGKLAAIVRVVQTRPQAVKATLRFFRDVEFALNLEGNRDSAIDQSAPEGDNDPRALVTRGDAITIPMGGHSVAECLVVFANS